jgi:hypothetical protein
MANKVAIIAIVVISAGVMLIKSDFIFDKAPSASYLSE